MQHHKKLIIIAVMLFCIVFCAIGTCAGEFYSQDWRDFEIDIDGHHVELPRNYWAFTEETGLSEQSETADTTLIQPGEEKTVKMVSENGNSVHVIFYNSAEEEMPITDCYVIGFVVQKDDSAVLTLCNGVNSEQSHDEIVETLGEFSISMMFDDGSGLVNYYINENVKQGLFFFFQEGGQVEKMTVRTAY